MAVLTISDGCFAGTREDLSGPAVERLLRVSGVPQPLRETLPDEQHLIADALRKIAKHTDLILTTGGTGLAKRDVTPDATRQVCDRLIDGLAERMRAEGLRNTAMAPLSRSVCGTLGATMIVNLPGNPSGAATSLRRSRLPRPTRSSGCCRMRWICWRTEPSIATTMTTNRTK